MSQRTTRDDGRDKTIIVWRKLSKFSHARWSAEVESEAQEKGAECAEKPTHRTALATSQEIIPTVYSLSRLYGYRGPTIPDDTVSYIYMRTKTDG